MDDPSAVRALNGQVAIVTGASRGLGRHFAADLAECGASVVIMGRTAADLAVTESLVLSHGVGCVMLEGDVCDASLAARCVEAAGSLGPLKILVNNAGVGIVR